MRIIVDQSLGPLSSMNFEGEFLAQIPSALWTRFDWAQIDTDFFGEVDFTRRACCLDRRGAK